MRVAVVLEHLDPRRGGLEQWTWQFARTMADRGHEIHLLARSFAPPADNRRILFHTVVAQRSRMQYAAAAERMLLALDCDLVHDTGAGWRCGVFQPHFGSRQALLESRLRMLPAVVQPARRLAIRLLPRYREFRRLAARQYVNDGRLFVALSKRVADDFVRFHDVSRESIRIVPNGVDCVRFSPDHRAQFRAAVRRELGIGENTVLLLLVAHNFRLKGVGPALRALKRMRRRSESVHLAILGGHHRQGYPLLAQSLGVRDDVSFLGARPDPVPYLAAADVLVHPTFYDTCSLVALEALASGLPVVLSHATGVDELMTDGREGWLISDPRQAEILADRIRRLLDPRERSRMGAAARQLALRHSFERNCDQIEAVYREIAARSGATRAA